MSTDEDLRDIISINDVIHTPVRLAILMFLAPRPNALFPEIRKALNLTAGNLSSHVTKLDKAGFIFVEKRFIEAKPTTSITLSPQGVKALNEYANFLQQALTNITGK